MSLYRRGRIWWIELTAESGRVRESSGTADKKAAQEFHEKRKSEIWRQGKLGEKPPVTWGEAVKKWMSVKPRSLSDRYLIARFGFSLSAALPLPGATITKQLSENLTADSPGSWNRYLSLIIAIHNTAGASPPEIDRKPNPPGRTRWLTAEEWARLRKALDEESQLLRQAAEFTLATGLRENNVLNLEWGQVDLRRRVAWLHGDQMKGKVPLGVPLNDAAEAVLRDRRGIHKRWVFGNPDTILLLRPAIVLGTLRCRKAKLRGFRWHDLRHTWASWAVMSGVRLEEVQRLGGGRLRRWCSAIVIYLRTFGRSCRQGKANLATLQFAQAREERHKNTHNGCLAQR
jgi:integrase